MDLFGGYDHIPVGLTCFLKQFIRPIILTNDVVLRTDENERKGEREKFVVKMCREKKIKEDEG